MWFAASVCWSLPLLVNFDLLLFCVFCVWLMWPTASDSISQLAAILLYRTRQCPQCLRQTSACRLGPWKYESVFRAQKRHPAIEGMVPQVVAVPNIANRCHLCAVSLPLSRCQRFLPGHFTRSCAQPCANDAMFGSERLGQGLQGWSANRLPGVCHCWGVVLAPWQARHLTTGESVCCMGLVE